MLFLDVHYYMMNK